MLVATFSLFDITQFALALSQDLVPFILAQLLLCIQVLTALWVGGGGVAFWEG